MNDYLLKILNYFEARLVSIAADVLWNKNLNDHLLDTHSAIALLSGYTNEAKETPHLLQILNRVLHSFYALDELIACQLVVIRLGAK